MKHLLVPPLHAKGETGSNDNESVLPIAPELEPHYPMQFNVTLRIHLNGGFSTLRDTQSAYSKPHRQGWLRIRRILQSECTS